MPAQKHPISDEQLIKNVELLKAKATAFDNYLSKPAPAGKKIKDAEKMQNDELAEYVAGVSQSLFLGLVNFKPYIEELWRRFEKIRTDRSDETIAGCHTKDEFCEKILKRTRRAVNYMLTGGNPVSKRRETVSRPDLQNPPPATPQQDTPSERESVSQPDPAALEIQQAKRRRGFVRQNPEYKDKSAEEIDAALLAKYGTATLLKGQIPIHQSGASVSSTVENPSAGNGSNPIAPLQNSEDELADMFSPRLEDGPPQSEFYAIRRKSDGALYRSHWHSFTTDVLEANRWKNPPFKFLSEINSGKEDEPPPEVEVVRVEVSYKLAVVAPAKSGEEAA